MARHQVSVVLAVGCVFAPRIVHAQSLEERVAVLETQIAKLQSGQVDATDLVGTYAIHVLGIELLGNPARTGVETFAGTATLNADAPVSFTGVDARCTLQESSPWFVTCDEQPESGTATWFVEGGRLIIREERDTVFTIGAGGRVGIAGGTVTAAGFSNLMLAIRLPNQ